MGTRVLVVDDDPATVEMLTLALELEGYQVISAACGSEALAIAELDRPHLVMLDVMMPGINGLDVARELRDHGTLGATPILMLSAGARDVDVWSAWMAGADAYVTKPMDVDHLLDEVRRLLATGTDRVPS